MRELRRCTGNDRDTWNSKRWKTMYDKVIDIFPICDQDQPMDIEKHREIYRESVGLRNWRELGRSVPNVGL